MDLVGRASVPAMGHYPNKSATVPVGASSACE